MAFPIFITRVRIGTGPGMVLISMESPGGGVSKGEAQNVEALRVVMSQSTFTEVTQLFSDQLKKIELDKAAAENSAAWHAEDKAESVGSNTSAAVTKLHFKN